jgi:hypothetical protein
MPEAGKATGRHADQASHPTQKFEAVRVFDLLHKRPEELDHLRILIESELVIS